MEPRAGLGVVTNARGKVAVVREKVAWLPILGLFVWDANDASGPQAVPEASLFLGIIAAIYLFAVVRRHGTKFTLPTMTTALLCGCMFFGIAMIPLREDVVMGHVLSDIGTLLFVILCLILADMYLRELLSVRTVIYFCLGYAAIAVFAYVAGVNDLRPAYYYGGRWDPPYYMLFGGLALLARYLDRVLFRVISLIGIVAFLGLALNSGNRTQFLLALLCIFLVWASDRRLLFVMALAVVGFVFLRAIGIITFDPFEGVFAQSRFGLLSGGADESLDGRFTEVSDIWYHLTRLNSPEQTIFGRGAGALWHPIARTRVIVDASGNLYYIHIGFVHMMYRFGLVGLFLFFYWVWAAFRTVPMLFDAKSSIGERFWILGGIGFALNFFLQNSLYDPPAVLAFAVLLIISEHRRRDLAAARDDVSAATTRYASATRRSGAARHLRTPGFGPSVSGGGRQPQLRRPSTGRRDLPRDAQSRP